MNKEWVQVDLHWGPTDGFLFSLWHRKNCLYAYCVGSTILYIGEAVYCTVRERYNAHERDGVNKQVRSEFPHQTFNVIVADIRRNDAETATPSLIHDIESVLIYKRQPSANVLKKKSIDVDYPLTVECKGAWPGPWVTHYHDGNPVPEYRRNRFRADLALGMSPRPNPFGIGTFASDMRLGLLGRLITDRLAQPSPPPPDAGMRRITDLIRTSNDIRKPGFPNVLRLLSDEDFRK